MSLHRGFRIGPYEIGRLIGSGSGGEVYRACDTRIGRPVAIKVLAGQGAVEPDRLARFTHEARTTSMLRHANIVSVLEVGAENGRPYVVSELLQGRTLRVRLNAGSIQVLPAVSLAREIVQGLIAAHHVGIVHRDLKPENVFLTADGGVKILDFGLAKRRSESLGLFDDSASTQPGTILGTVGYMSPEQVKGGLTDERSDIFSVGVMLYEMIAGFPPFRRETPVETLYAILKDDLPPLPRSAAITDAVTETMRHCLEKNSNARFQSARDLGFVLELILRAGRTVRPVAVGHRILQSLFGLF
jgi:serine/threonine protein kinase